MSPQNQEADSLDSLEERILKTVELVQRLRQEKDAAVAAASDATARCEAVLEELESLRNERKLVRGRIEKLLGHIDRLSTA
jgi:FtsZ-binding cell division protein ZapB